MPQPPLPYPLFILSGKCYVQKKKIIFGFPISTKPTKLFVYVDRSHIPLLGGDRIEAIAGVAACAILAMSASVDYLLLWSNVFLQANIRGVKLRGAKRHHEFCSGLRSPRMRVEFLFGSPCSQ